MKTMMEKWEQYISEGTFVGDGSGRTLIKILEEAVFWAEQFNPDVEHRPLSGEVRAEILLQFGRLQEAMQKFEPNDLNEEIINETPT